MRETKAERRLRRACLDEYAAADGAHHDAQQQKRIDALAYYRGEARGDEVEGRSQSISQDVNASVTTNLAMMRSMLITDCSVECKPEAPGDGPRAEAETQVVKRIIYDENPGELELIHALKDGLINGQAVMNVEAVEREGEPIEFKVRAVPSENVSYQAAFEGRLQDIRFFGERRYYMRSDLTEMGVSQKKVDMLTTGADSNTRDKPTGSRKAQGAEDEIDTIECRWNYIRLDIDGDDVAELHRVLTGPNDMVLMHDEVDFIPYAMGNAFIDPHRLSGEGLYDKLKQTQDVQTAFLRGLIDNVSLINNGRFVYDSSRVNEADVMNPVAGGGIRARDVTAIMPLQIPDATSGIMGAMEQMRRRRSEVAGASIDMASADAQIMNKSATQASIDKSNSEIVSSLIASNFALTLIEPLFRLVHLSVRTYGTQPYPVVINGQQVPIRPQQFSENRMFRVNVGKSPQEKSMETQALSMHLQMQTMAMQSGLGGVLANETTLYKTARRLLTLAGADDPDQYLIDPQSPEAQQAQQAQAQQQQQQMQMQQAMMQDQQNLEKAKIEEDARQHDSELEFKYWDAQLDAATQEAQLLGQNAFDLEKEERARVNGTGAGDTGGSDANNGGDTQ